MSTAVAIRDPQTANQPLSLVEIRNYADVFIQSGMFPDIVKAAQAVVKIQAGQELGLPPFQAMKSLHIIKGNITLAGHLIAARVKAHPRYDYEVTHCDAEYCEGVFFDKITGKQKPHKYTIQQARRAGNAGKDMYSKYPEAMLFNRWISSGYKLYAPDATNGVLVYTPDELGGAIDCNGDAASARAIDIGEATMLPAPSAAGPEMVSADPIDDDTDHPNTRQFVEVFEEILDFAEVRDTEKEEKFRAWLETGWQKRCKKLSLSPRPSMQEYSAFSICLEEWRTEAVNAITSAKNEKGRSTGKGEDGQVNEGPTPQSAPSTSSESPQPAAPAQQESTGGYDPSYKDHPALKRYQRIFNELIEESGLLGGLKEAKERSHIQGKWREVLDGHGLKGITRLDLIPGDKLDTAFTDWQNAVRAEYAARLGTDTTAIEDRKEAAHPENRYKAKEVQRWAMEQWLDPKATETEESNFKTKVVMLYERTCEELKLTPTNQPSALSPEDYAKVEERWRKALTKQFSVDTSTKPKRKPMTDAEAFDALPDVAPGSAQ